MVSRLFYSLFQLKPGAVGYAAPSNLINFITKKMVKEH